MHVFFRWSIQIVRALPYSTGLLWLWSPLPMSFWGELYLIYSNVMVFSLGLCFSRHIMYMGFIVLFSGPFMPLYHVSCIMYFVAQSHIVGLTFILCTCLSRWVCVSPTSFEIIYYHMNGDFYQYCRSCPLHYLTILNLLQLCLSLSLIPLLVSCGSVIYNVFRSYDFLLTLIHVGEICYHQKMTT